MRKDFTPNYQYYTNGKNIVVAVCRYAGRRIRAVAKCNPMDTFDLEKGKEIAKVRVDLKVAYLRNKKALQTRRAAEKAAWAAWEVSKDAHEYWMDTHQEVIELENKLTDVLKGV